jgi:hypothetical protein
MVIEGAIAERTRAIFPVTWDALARDSRYGDGLLQTTIDTVKESVTGEVIAPEDEASTYPLIVIDYIAKVVALEMISPGIDFWMNEPVSESATGTNENHSFVDRARTLSDLREQLLEETRAKAGEIAEILGYRRARRTGVPRSNTLEDEFLTPSHQEMPRLYAPTTRS